mgnify:FL=1
MKSIEIFNETNSNLNKAVNMALEVTLRQIEEASKVGRTYIQEDFQSAEIKDGVSNYLEEKGYLCISLYNSTLYITWDMRVMRTAYFTYKKYAENYVCSSDYKITAESVPVVEVNNVKR